MDGVKYMEISPQSRQKCVKLNKTAILICTTLLILLLPTIQPVAIAESETNLNESITEPSVQWPRPPLTTLRLPNTTHPMHYYLHVHTNIDRGDLTYTGNVSIIITVHESTNEIVLHAETLKIHEINVYEWPNGDPLDGITHSYVDQAQFLVIHPAENYQAFEAGRQYRVKISYANTLNSHTFGIYWLTYKNADKKPVYMAATQFEPTSARLAFPCYDEPAFKANFTISLTHATHYMSLSNMPVRDVKVHSDDTTMVTTTFDTTPLMSTYLVAFVISDFDYISDEYRGVTQRIYSPPNSRQKGVRALKNAVRCVAAMEDYFGIAYPLTKLDHIGLEKNYGGAMENWGLITYKQEHLLHEDDYDVTAWLKDMITQNHEISHQWFGNLVSPEWWTYAWMNEGFATYFAYVITDMLYPDRKVLEFFLTDIAERATSYYHMSPRAMTHYVEKKSEIIDIFDIVTYQRAACVIKMFHHAFGRKTFVRGVSHFLNKFQYTVANEMHLFEAIQAVLRTDALINDDEPKWLSAVPDIMKSWTHSEGMPFVRVVRNYENGTITIMQRPKILKSNELWWIPLNAVSASRPNFENTRADYFMPPVTQITLTPTELGVPELQNTDWVIVNKQQTAFYHVAYDDMNLRILVKELQNNHHIIHIMDRVALLQDLCPMIEHHEIDSIEWIFEFLKYLEREEELLPWNFVSDIFDLFSRYLYGTPSQEFFKQFSRQLIKPIFKQLFKSDSSPQLTNTEVLARKSVLQIASRTDLPECLEHAQLLSHDYIFVESDNPEDNINDTYYDLFDILICSTLKHITDDEFNALLNRFSEADPNSTWYNDILYGLSCLQNEKHLHQVLELLLGENSTQSMVNNRDALSFLLFLYNTNLAAQPILLRFLETHYKYLCRSLYFIECFNRMAEYISQQLRADFIKLRNEIAIELEQQGLEENLKVLIAADSNHIGKNMKKSEQFLERFGDQTYEWLYREMMPDVYASSFSAHNGSNRLSSTIHTIRKHFHSFLKRKAYTNYNIG